MNVANRLFLLVFIGALQIGVSYAETESLKFAAKRDWAATETEKACTKKCQKESDALVYENCLIDCNKAGKDEAKRRAGRR